MPASSPGVDEEAMASDGGLDTQCLDRDQVLARMGCLNGRLVAGALGAPSQPVCIVVAAHCDVMKETR